MVERMSNRPFGIEPPFKPDRWFGGFHHLG